MVDNKTMEMSIEQFYLEFNKISMEHETIEKTTNRLNDLMNFIEGSEILPIVMNDINIPKIAKSLDKQLKENVSNKRVDRFESQFDVDEADYEDPTWFYLGR